MPLLRQQPSRPEVAAVEDVDEDGNPIAGAVRYARSTAAPSPPPPSNPIKTVMNTSKKKSSSSRRASVHQYEYDTDIMPSPDSPPAAPRRESSKSEKRRSSISTKQPKDVVVDNGKSKRPVPRSSKTMPGPPGYPSESAFYGVHAQTTPASSRPRAQTRPASYYGQGPGMPGMPGMPGGPGRPPLSNSAMYYPPGPMGPPGFPPGAFHGAGGPGMPSMGPPPHLMMAHSPISAGPGPMPSPGGYFPPSGPPETLASRFHRSQEHRPRSAMGFQGPPGHYEEFGDYMEEPAPAPAPRGGLVRRQSVSQAPPKRQPKEIEAREMGPPMVPPRRPQTARPQSMSLPYRPQPLSIMKSTHFHEDELDDDSGMISHPNPKRALGQGFESYEYGKSTVARRHHRHPSFDDSSDLDEEEAYQREPAAGHQAIQLPRRCFHAASAKAPAQHDAVASPRHHRRQKPDNSMGGAPSKPGDGARQLEVIGAGYSRTGTVTMQLALEEILGGPVIHGGTHLLSREDAYNRKWHEAYQARRAGDHARVRKLVRELTTGYVGITDLPGNDFLPELLELYPDARVVLVTRDPQRWVQSIGRIRQHLGFQWLLHYIMAPIPTWRWVPALIEEFGRSALELRGGAGSNVPQELILQNHNAMVKSLVPPDRLLVMDLKEGWAPLARFLGRPVPDGPFPRANDAEALDRVARDVFTKVALTWAAMLAVGGAAVYTGLRYAVL